MKKNKIFNRRVVRRISILSLLGVATIIGIWLLVFMTTREAVAAFYPHILPYESEQSVIASNTSSANLISMTDANTDNSNNGKTITISTPQEFYLFSEKCESNTTFLEYSYELMCDIDFATSGISNVKPIGYSTPFSGDFNGNGYEIKNIPLLTITSSNASTYGYYDNATTPIKYFALFSKNSGTIRNLGVLNPIITVTYSPKDSDAYVAPFVGLNTGIIHHSYVKETRSRDTNSTGINAGAFVVSGFASVNDGAGKIHDIYVSRTILVATTYKGTFISEAEVLNSKGDNAKLENAYFYDSTINSYTGSDGGVCTILFNGNYVERDIREVTHYGTYSPSEEQLTLDVVSHDSQTTKLAVGSWYNLSKYSQAAQAFLKDENGNWIYGTPIARGIPQENNLTFSVASNREFAYMYELFQVNKSFATSVATFEITTNIDMGCMSAPKGYTSDIGCNIVGKMNGTSGKITIYNAPINQYYSKTLGIDCFGVFPWLTGSVSYIDVILGSSTTPYIFTYDRGTGQNVDNNKFAIGAISGYVDGGTISNCNVYLNINIDNSINKFYFGGIAGMIGSTTSSIGNVSNSTVTGTITHTNSRVGTLHEDNGYITGMVIGGAVGYLDSTTGSVDTVLSEVNITSAGVSGENLVIGGVVGAGYAYKLNQLQYEATIQFNQTSGSYTSLYLSGVVGRLLGAKEQVDYLTNKGAITVTQASNVETYISGVINADIITPLSSSTYLPVSNNPLVEKGAYYFWGSSFTNNADIVVNNGSNNLCYTDVLNLKSGNSFSSELSGLYDYSRTNPVSFKMNQVSNFAPILNNIGGTSNYRVNLSTAYNFKNISITTNAETSNDVKYAGVALGQYISYTNVHNLGNIDISVSNNVGATGNNNSKNIKVAGVFEEVSAGCMANNIYNAGNININYTAIIYGNVYASGICLYNKNGITDIDKYNPAKPNFDSSLKGSIDAAINNGEVKVTSSKFSTDLSYKYLVELSPNGQSYLGNVVETSFKSGKSPVYIDGDLFSSGITSINESVITNSFNLGDITSVNFAQNTVNQWEINSAGISVLNVGKYAYILNSANNADIKAFNLSSEDFSEGTKDNVATNTGISINYISDTNASGISCRNDELENGTSYTGNVNNSHSSQVISFTINYGSVFSYNYKTNVMSTSMEPNAKSAGILAMGLCNVINVVNYGNIYGSETASGIFGVVYFTKFTSEVSSPIYIANTLNYGNVYILSRGFNHIHGSSSADYNWIEYDDLDALDITTAQTKNYQMTSVIRNTGYISIIGSIFSIVNFGNSNNAEQIKIRYLISYLEEVSISGAITGYLTNANPDVSTFYSAHKLINAQTGAYMTDTYMGKYVIYAPLSTNHFTGTFVTNINPSTGDVTTDQKTYYGVFSNNFDFRKAIDGDVTKIDIANYHSDTYITDYFEFIGAIKANPDLLQKIGWSEISYRAAAEDFATNLESVGKFVDYISTLQNSAITDLVTNALKANTWMNKCNNQNLLSIVDSLIQNEDSSVLLAMVDYVFSSSAASYSLINNETRSQILSRIVAQDTTLSYATLLDSIITYTNNYSSILADSILNNDEAAEYLKHYINSLQNDQVEDILNTYCEYLSTASTNLYFSYKNTEQKRYSILDAMFANINTSSFYADLADLINIGTPSGLTLSDTLSMYNGYNTLNESQKINLYRAIIINNTSNTSFTNLVDYIDEMASKIDYFARLVEKGYQKTSFNDIETGISYNTSDTSESVIDERVALWNLIKDTSVFDTYIRNKNIGTIYDLATEYNNTYQSITEPHNDGAYVGDTDNNRLSYMYTLVITPQVYFYGPYTTSEGSLNFANANSTETGSLGLNNPITNHASLNVTNYQNKYFSLFHYDDNALWESQDIMLSRGNRNTIFSQALSSAGNHTYPYPMLIFYDYNNEQLGGANAEYTLSSNYYVSGPYTPNVTTFRGFNDNQQFKYDKTSITDPLVTPITKKGYNSNDWTGTLFKTNDYYMYVSDTGETFSLNKAVLAKAYSTGGGTTLQIGGRSVVTQNYRCYIQDSDGAYHLIQTSDSNATIQIGHMVDGEFEATHTLKNYSSNSRQIYSFISYEVGLRMYTSTVNSTYHQTGRTGIYRRSGGWNNYFTWKQTNNNRVWTSQYIDYNVDDILNLDGYLTQYNDGTYKSTDERNIINRVFNTYFINDSNFMNVVKSALLENNMYNSNGQADIDYLNNFFVTNIYSSKLIDNKTPFAYLYQAYSSKTVMQYLKDQYSNPDAKHKFLAYCATNQSAYADLIIKLIELNANRYKVESPGGVSISISNVSSHTNSYIVPSNQTINGENFTSGIEFSSMSINLLSSYKHAYLYVKPKSSEATLTIKLDSDTVGTTETITTSSNNYITVNLNNNSTLNLLSDNDVILYKVMVDYESSPITATIQNYYQPNVIEGSSITLLEENDLLSVVEAELSSNDITPISMNLVYLNSTTDSNTTTIYVGEKNNTNINKSLKLIRHDDNSIEYTYTVPANTTYEKDVYARINNNIQLGMTFDLYYYNGSTYELANGTDYSIVSCKYNILYQYTVMNQSTLFDSSTFNTILTNNLSTATSVNSTLDALTDYNDLYDEFIEDALCSLIPIDYSSTISNPIYNGTASKNLIEILGLRATHDNLNPNPDNCAPHLLETLITTSNEAFRLFINSFVSTSTNKFTDYNIILTTLVENVGYYSLVDVITNQKNNISTDSKYIIAAAYLATDYQDILDNGLAVGTSKLKYYIDEAMKSYQYIETNSYDNDKFVSFALVVGYDTSKSGYGIYALASSYGILDGRFIPDNLVLSSMNPYYDSTKTIVSTPNAYWRSGSSNQADAENKPAGSVNNAFSNEMKQIKLSISTAIIELDLTDGTNLYMANDNQTTRNGTEGTITYYITETELASITTSLTITNVSIANNAKLYLNSNLYDSTSNKTITVSKNGNSLTTSDKFMVEAEDTDVKTYYDIIFVILPTTGVFSLDYKNGTDGNLPYTGSDIELELTADLPKNIDLSPYITISNGVTSYNYLTNRTLFETYFSYYTYGNYQVTNENGDASIKFRVFQVLPAGEYTITVQVGALSDYVTFEKAASTENNIVKLEFDNETITPTGTLYQSVILFGREINKADLEVASGSSGMVIPSYLSDFEISPNATYGATATYTYDQNHLVVYTITYTVTSESGSVATYTHTLTEKAPYLANDTFATVYENGDIYNTAASYTTTNADNNNVLSSASSLNISFTRDIGTPEYRTKYVLTNFDLTAGTFLVEDVSDTYSTIGSGSGVAAVGAPYGGITATITKACDVGTYVFRYTYTSSSTWDSDTLNRTYIFPLIYITKTPSEDSWISRLAFIDEYLADGRAITKLGYQNAFVPNENNQTNQELYHYAQTEHYYQTFENTTYGITMDQSNDIRYNNADYKKSNKNYYVLGSVNDASLASYAPTMTIEEHAEIYQYLTDRKTNGSYGGTSQATNDTSLLETSGTDTIYLYLPYYIDNDGTPGESSGDTYEIFLVKMTISTVGNQTGIKRLSEVYFAKDGIYDSEGTKRSSVANLNNNITLQDIHSASNTFTISGETYKISSVCGKTNSSALYMNYIGDPAEGHFWYVSYAVFSEAYIKNTNDTTHVDYYHISVIDSTNNIYFTIKVNVPNGFSNAIYMNVNYITYDNEEQVQSSLALYVVESSDANVLVTQYQLAMLPTGYYTFTLELTPGYKVSYIASRDNKQGSNSDSHKDVSELSGTYLPTSSIVPIQIDLEFTVEVDTEISSATNVWGMGTSSTETVVATYDDGE